tara:strand:+ start:504 stop:1013 length:510 start_codon:yes stop_codon:yes gene_type:complete
MTEEINFKCICDLTTSVLGIPKGALGLKSRKRPLQVARSVAGYIARSEEDIDRTIIAKGLNRDRSLIYHYEKRHKPLYKTCLIYRNTFNKVYKAYKDIDQVKEIFIDGSLMRQHILRNGVRECAKPDVLIEVKSGEARCIINTSYFDFSNQLENVKSAMKNYHFSVKII